MSYDGIEAGYSWDQLLALEETDSHFLLCISPTRGYLTPRAAFSSPEQISDYINLLRSYWTAEPENFGRTLSDHPHVNYLLKRFFQDLRANFVAALRTVFLRPVVAIAFRANTTQLTSHGSRQHTLSVEFWPLALNSLPASQLKTLRDASSSVNRVIVVSACFSGGFIDVLKDEHSLIITAAVHDKTLLGCGT